MRRGWCRPSLDVVWNDGLSVTIIGALDLAPDRLGAWWARMALHRVLHAGSLESFERSRHTEQDDVVRLLEKAEAECAREARVVVLDDVRARGAALSSTLSPRRVGTR